MTKRPLTTEEKERYNRVLARNEEERGIVEYELLLKKMFVEKGLDISYKKALQQAKNEVAKQENDLKILLATIDSINDQIKNGVTVQEKTSESEE